MELAIVHIWNLVEVWDLRRLVLTLSLYISMWKVLLLLVLLLSSSNLLYMLFKLIHVCSSVLTKNWRRVDSRFLLLAITLWTVVILTGYLLVRTL
jgi:hypothetical protein